MIHPPSQARRVPSRAGQPRLCSERSRGARFLGPSSGENCQTFFGNSTASTVWRKAHHGLEWSPFVVRLGDRFPGLFILLEMRCWREVVE